MSQDYIPSDPTRGLAQLRDDGVLHFLCFAGRIFAGIPTIAEAIALATGNEVEMHMKDRLTAGRPGVLQEIKARGTCGLKHSGGDFREMTRNPRQQRWVEVDQIGEMPLCDEQRVTRSKWANVQKCQTIVVFEDFR